MSSDLQEVINNDRLMLSRSLKSSIKIINQLIPGQHTPGCLVCCSAPVCCPVCSIFPCFDDAEYIKRKRESSKYVFIRENSIEWNEPKVIMRKGSCLGLDPCQYDVQVAISPHFVVMHETVYIFVIMTILWHVHGCRRLVYVTIRSHAHILPTCMNDNDSSYRIIQVNNFANILG